MFNMIKHTIQRAIASREEREAANLSPDTANDRVERDLGPAPSRNTFQYKQLIAGQEATVRLRERREDLASAQGASDAAGNPIARGAWAIALVAVELVSVLLLLRDLSIAPSARLGAASGLLLATVGLTVALTHVIARTGNSSGIAKIGWVIVSALAIVLFGSLVISFVLIRMAASTADRPLYVLLPEALLLALATAFPAWWLESAWRTFRAALDAWLDLRRVRRDMRRLERDAQRSERGIRDFEDREARHAREASRIRADLSIKRRAFEAGRRSREP